MNNSQDIKNVVLIGANGFIGSHLWRYLHSNFDAAITIVSRSFSKLNQKHAHESNVRLVTGDYSDLLSLTPVLKDADLVYHLASSSFPSSSWDNPVLDIKQNLIPTVSLLDHLSFMGVKKVAFISSGGTIYGKNQGRLTEVDTQKPFSPHGIIKLSIEHFLEHYRVKSGLNYDVYRLSNTYGPGQHKIGFGVINTWLRNAVDGKKIHLYGDGRVEKDFIFIDDAIKLIGYSMQTSLEQSEVLNVNSGLEFSLGQVLEIIESLVPDIEVEVHRSLLSDNKVVRLSNKKLLSLFPGFKFTSLEEGIARTLRSIDN